MYSNLLKYSFHIYVLSLVVVVVLVVVVLVVLVVVAAAAVVVVVVVVVFRRVCDPTEDFLGKFSCTGVV